MTKIGITFTTSDGHKWDNESHAKHHQALLDKIGRFLDAEGVPETRRKGATRRILAWIAWDSEEGAA